MSDINFSKLTWENLPARTTALSATNLNRIENGIADSVNGVNSNSHSIAELQTRISQIANGSPTPVATVAEMTDESAVYLYTGSETGYTAGNWYYYNGTAWTSGGIYGGATTSTTFNQHGVPADDFAVGEALAEKADADDLTAIDDRVTELESGSGLAEDGKQALLAIARSVVYTVPNGQELYSALYNAFYPPANLVRITAVYTQSGIVTSVSSLDSLKSDLVVTALYSDGTTVNVNDYVLSGRLVSGTSTITVTYSGKTATFTANVIDALYMLPESTVFDGTNYIDTGVKLASEDIDYTITFTETNGANVARNPVFHCMTESSPYPGLAFQKANVSGYAVTGYSRTNVQTAINPEANNTNKVVFRHEAGSQYLYVDYATNGVRGEQLVVDNSGIFAQSDNNLLIGCYQATNGDKGRFWRGIVSDFVILSSVIDDNAVTEYLGV